MPIAILAGGLGTRVSDISRNNPKSMIEIHGKPFVYWQISNLIQQGYFEILMCIGHKGSIIQEYLEIQFKDKAQISYSFDGELQLGTGGSIKKALPMLGDEFMVLYGDSYLPICFSKVESTFKDSGRPALMTVYKNSNALSPSNVLIEQDKVIQYSKSHDQAILTYIDYGLNLFSKGVFETEIEGTTFDLGVIFRKLISEELLTAYEIKERYYEIGSPKGIVDFQDYLKGKLSDIQ